MKIEPLYIGLENEETGDVFHKRLKPDGCLMAWWKRVRGVVWPVLVLVAFGAGCGLRGCVG